MATQDARPVTAGDIIAALRLRYAPPEFVLLTEVRDGTGWNGKRWADALAMGVWPSRGLELTGFEVKVSRSDWRREKRNPDKAESIALYCDRWFVVAPAGVVPSEEIPPSWGLLELCGGRLVAAVEPRVPLTPKPVDRSFLASLLRSAVRQAELPGKEALEAARKEGRQSERDIAQSRLDSAKHETAMALESIADFEAASGVRISKWHAGQIGQAVSLLMKYGGLESTASVLARLGHEATELASKVEAARAQLEGRHLVVAVQEEP